MNLNLNQDYFFVNCSLCDFSHICIHLSKITLKTVEKNDIFVKFKKKNTFKKAKNS